MAAFCLFMKNEAEFLQKLKEHDWDIIQKIVKCVLNGIKRKKKSVDVFEITYKDNSIMPFVINKENYKSFLEGCLADYVKHEEYEICAEIRDSIIKLTPKELPSSFEGQE